jgi:hypothetical protein
MTTPGGNVASSLGGCTRYDGAASYAPNASNESFSAISAKNTKSLRKNQQQEHQNIV